MGELLKGFDGRGKAKNGTAPISITSRQKMAAEAGLTEHQRVQAVRIANLTPDEFEGSVESPEPPGTTLLTKMGQRQRAVAEPMSMSGADLWEIGAKVSARKIAERLTQIAWELERYSDAERVADLLRSDEKSLQRANIVLGFMVQLKAVLDKARGRPKLRSV
jgi:hypothetical protein